MKLYIAAGRYVGTQVDAKRLDKDFLLVDVPVSKEELIAYLNWLIDQRPKTVIEKPVVVTASAPANPFSGSLTDVEEFIQNADHVQLGRVTENAILRMGELMRDLASRTADFGSSDEARAISNNVPQIFDEPEPEPVEEIDPLT